MARTSPNPLKLTAFSPDSLSFEAPAAVGLPAPLPPGPRALPRPSAAAPGAARRPGLPRGAWRHRLRPAATALAAAAARPAAAPEAAASGEDVEGAGGAGPVAREAHAGGGAVKWKGGSLEWAEFHASEYIYIYIYVYIYMIKII